MPAAPIRDLAQSAADEQLQYRKILTNQPAPSGDGEVSVVSAGHITEPAPPVVQRPAPTLGQHTGEILTELGYSQPAISELTNNGVIG